MGEILHSDGIPAPAAIFDPPSDDGVQVWQEPGALTGLPDRKIRRIVDVEII
jgi:hypothetical protein